MRKLQDLNNRFNHFIDMRRRYGNNILKFDSVFLFVYSFVDEKQYLSVF
jgi:hypothetical protein